MTSQRIAHWIKDTLKKTVIDMNKFTAHSVRRASASAAVGKGLHVSGVLKMADWSRESTFKNDDSITDCPLRKNMPRRRSVAQMSRSLTTEQVVIAVHKNTL